MNHRLNKYVLAFFLSTLVVFFGCASTKVIDEAEAKARTEKEVVVLLHGLGRSNASMWLLASRLESAGFHVERVGYNSLDQTPEEILNDIAGQIGRCCAAHKRSVHFVGHSLGGLMARAYLQNHRVENLGRVVLIGTPNNGSEFADYFQDSWLMGLVGPTAKVLGTGENSFPKSLAPPYYPVGVIAGVHEYGASESVIPGRDDGLVSVEATRLEGMTDFIIIETGHSMMRYNQQVASQTIAFLKNGKYERTGATGTDKDVSREK